MANIGSCLMIGLKGESLTLEEKKFIETFDIGGVILFKRNARTYKGLQKLCRQIYGLKTSSPILIAIDREGHPVDRLRDIPEFMNWKVPHPIKLSLNEIVQTSFFLNQELRHLGIHMNLSPCLDLSNPQSEVLQNRTFSKNPITVGQVGQAWIQGSFRAGVLNCIKHFPGHGSVKEDSHLKRPVDFSSRSHIEFSLLPFKQNIQHASSVMLSHILYPELDKECEASLSFKIIQKLLKEKLGFSNFILSDDIEMKALQKYSLLQIAQKALSAGTHFLICGNFETAQLLVSQVSSRSSAQQNQELKKWILLRAQEILQIKKRYIHYLTPSFPSLNPHRKKWFESLQN